MSPISKKLLQSRICFQFLGGAAFGFEFLGVRLPAQLQALPHLIEAATELEPVASAVTESPA
jgi:hypothetical protein